jgi:predicted amidohydrolase
MDGTIARTMLASVQMRASPQDVTGNLAKATRFLAEAGQGGAKLVLLPELFNVGYFIGPELFELWEQDDGRTVTWMREQASRHSMLVAGSIAEQRGTRLFNTLFVAEPDGQLHRYSKRNPYKTELAAFDHGDDASIINTSLGRIGCAICSDLNWGQSLLRPLAGNVDLVLFPQASSAPRWMGRRMSRHEQARGDPSTAGLVKAIGAPMARAGLIGPIQRVVRLIGGYLMGGTWIAEADGKGRATVAFDTEGLAMGEVTLGSTGGDRTSAVFRDPGFVRDLMDSLVVSLPNYRPQRVDPASRA